MLNWLNKIKKNYVMLHILEILFENKKKLKKNKCITKK
jgi:hypothetical protein